MMESLETLKTELASLPIRDRADLAQFLIHTLNGQEDADAEAAWDRELARRGEEIASGRAVGVPLEQVLARLREKYP